MTVLAILRYLILEGYEKPGKSTSTKQADSSAMMSAREERLPKKYGAKQKNRTDDVLHKVGPVHRTVRLWSHNGGSYGNTKDVQKVKRPRIQIPGTNERVAVLPTAKVHRVQGRMGGDSR